MLGRTHFFWARSEQSNKTDLLISDVVMTEMNGKDLAHNQIGISVINECVSNCMRMGGY